MVSPQTELSLTEDPMTRELANTVTQGEHPRVTNHRLLNQQLSNQRLCQGKNLDSWTGCRSRCYHLWALGAGVCLSWTQLCPRQNSPNSRLWEHGSLVLACFLRSWKKRSLDFPFSRSLQLLRGCSVCRQPLRSRGISQRCLDPNRTLSINLWSWYMRERSRWIASRVTWRTSSEAPQAPRVQRF